MGGEGGVNPLKASLADDLDEASAALEEVGGLLVPVEPAITRSRPAARPALVRALPQVCSGLVLYVFKFAVVGAPTSSKKLAAFLCLSTPQS